MPDYRLYFLDRSDHVRRALDLDCRDDGHAISVVSDHLSHNAMELWQGDRLVRRFQAQNGD